MLKLKIQGAIIVLLAIPFTKILMNKNVGAKYKTWEDKLRICRRLFGRIKNDGGGAAVKGTVCPQATFTIPRI